MRATLGFAFVADECYEEAYKIFRNIPIDFLDESALVAFMRAGTFVGGDLAYDEIISRIDMARDDRIVQLIECIDALGDIRGLKILTQVLEENPLFDEAGIVSFLSRWNDSFTNPLTVSKVAYYIWVYIGPEGAYNYLQNKWRANPDLLNSPEFCQRVTECATNCRIIPKDFSEVMMNELVRVINTGDLKEWEKLRSAGFKLPKQIFIQLLRLSLEYQSRNIQMEINILLEMARLLRSNGELEEAAEYMLRAKSLLINIPEEQQRINEELKNIELLINNTKPLLNYLKVTKEYHIEQLRPHLAGKVVMLVGGWKQEWAEQLSEELGLAKLDWRESEKGERFDLKPIQDTLSSNRVSVMVIIWNYKGHAGQDKLIEKAQAVNTKVVYSKLGYQNILKVLYEEICKKKN